MRILIDFETQSAADLKRAGAFEYAVDASTRIMCMAFKLPTSSTVHLFDFDTMQKNWKSLPVLFRTTWLKWVGDSRFRFVAQNAFFEQCIYEYILVRRLGWPRIPIHKWACTAAKAAAVAIPRNLGDAGAVMKTKVQKDFDGYRVMMKLCKPTAAWKNWQAAEAKAAHMKTQGRYPEPPKFYTPKNAHDDFQLLYKYCKIDAVSEELLDHSLPDLNATEQRLWCVDQKMNLRGVQVDMPLVNKIAGILASESKTMGRELDTLTMGLVSSGNARQAILDFLALEEIDLPDLKSKTVDDFLANGKVTGDAAKILHIRRALSKASTAKYKTFQIRAKHDGRVRDLLMYHAASTGRWGGKGIQPQNFPRGVIKDIGEAIERINTCGLDDLKMLYGENLMPLFSSVLRGMFIASPGYQLFVEDYNAIECRVTWWLAGHEAGLDMFRAGIDPYKMMAAAIYKKSILEITDGERQVGKAAVLGCFGPSTLVLTDSGWKPIVEVKAEDQLWDGVEWVRHAGVVYQGMKKTINLFGVMVTPEHLLLTPQGWKPAEAVRRASEKSLKSILRLVNLPSSGIGGVRGAAYARLKYSALVGQAPIRFIFTTFYWANQRGVTLALKKLRIIGKKSTHHILGHWQTRATALGYLTGFPLKFLDAIAQNQKATFTTAGGALPCAPNGEMTGARFLPTSKPYQIGGASISTLIESITMGATGRETFALFLKRLTPTIEEKWRTFKIKLQSSPKKLSVYDIADAGPRNRFVVATSKGPMIAHNCGYQMGAKKFMTSAFDVYRAKVDLPTAKIAVTAYRDEHWPVAEMWEGVEAAAIQAVENPGRVFRVKRIRFQVHGRFLKVILPSGRMLSYCDPMVKSEKVYVYMVKGEANYTGSLEILRAALKAGANEGRHFDTKRLSYMAVNHKAKNVDCVIPKWTREKTYGGKLTENIVQAVARDILAEAIVRADKAGFDVLMHSHDELVCEARLGARTENEYRKIMEELPTWAEGLPLKSSGWVDFRYRKG